MLACFRTCSTCSASTPSAWHKAWATERRCASVSLGLYHAKSTCKHARSDVEVIRSVGLQVKGPCSCSVRQAAALSPLEPQLQRSCGRFPWHVPGASCSSVPSRSGLPKCRQGESSCTTAACWPLLTALLVLRCCLGPLHGASTRMPSTSFRTRYLARAVAVLCSPNCSRTPCSRSSAFRTLTPSISPTAAALRCLTPHKGQLHPEKLA